MAACRWPRWTESIAVGSERFVQRVQQTPELPVKGHKVREGADHYGLREPAAAYDALFTLENRLLRPRRPSRKVWLRPTRSASPAKRNGRMENAKFG